MHIDGVTKFGCSLSKRRNIISNTARVIAVSVYNTQGSAYIEADFSNGFYTYASAQWKCTNQFNTGWNNISFDDSNWTQATDHGPNDIGADDEVKKIWTSEVSDNSTVYCRGHIGECVHVRIHRDCI